jgi:cytochrome c oxidase subunit I+III
MSDYVAGGVPEQLVPRTTEGRNGREVSALAARRRGPSLGVWGMAMLIASEATLFGSFIGSYYYLRFTSPHWPPVGTPEPRVVVPLVLAGVLALTSLPMQLAAGSARRGRRARAIALILLALVVQSGYFAFEVHDFADQLHRFTLQQNAYGSIYYTLLGAAHAHVCVGLLLSVWLIGKLARGLTMYRLNATQAVTVYWHAVNALTLVVTGVLLTATI